MVTSANDVMTVFNEQAFRALPRVVVAHSNAGHYAPTVARDSGADGVVFMDAALPAEKGPGPLAPPGLLRHVGGLADDDGWLPGWTDWWEREVVLDLLPDPTWLDLIEAGQPRVALEYFRSELEAPQDWTSSPCAYLAFGDRYQDELVRAQAYGWPNEMIEGGHLHYLVSERRVADRIEDLVSMILGPGWLASGI